VPLIIYFWLLGRMLERYGKTDWGRIFVLAGATFGTFLTTFAIVLNNHVTGAVTTLVAVYAARGFGTTGGLSCAISPWQVDGRLTAADELPALSFSPCSRPACYGKRRSRR